MSETEFGSSYEILEQIGYDRFWEKDDLAMAYGQLISGIALESTEELMKRLSRLLGREVLWGHGENCITLQQAIEQKYGMDALSGIRKSVRTSTNSALDNY